MADEATNPTPNDNPSPDQPGQDNAPTGADSVSDQQAPVETTDKEAAKADQTASRKKAGSASPQAKPQGEVKVDTGAKSEILGGEDKQTQDELLHNARNDALVNHKAHVAEQPAA